MDNIDDYVGWILIVLMIVALLCGGLSLVWTIRYPTPEVNIQCIRAGYDKAEQPLFAAYAVCVKRVPLAIALER